MVCNVTTEFFSSPPSPPFLLLGIKTPNDIVMLMINQVNTILRFDTLWYSPASRKAFRLFKDILDILDLDSEAMVFRYSEV